LEDDKKDNKKPDQKKKDEMLSDFITLKDINVDIKKGEFVIIIGDVASGKSSFLYSLIGDMLSLDKDFVDDLKDKVLTEDLRKRVKAHSH